MMIDRKREMLIIESNGIYWREQSMNKRTITIIQNLCEPNKERTIASLAEEFHVSQRTIRNDLGEINTLLVSKVTKRWKRHSHIRSDCISNIR